MDSESFDKISNVISADDTYERIVHDVCRMQKVASLNEFLRIYEMEENAIDNEYDDTPKTAPTVELFADIFKKLDEYPTNLQKFKKPLQMRERLNSNVSKSSPTLNDSSSYVSNKEISTSLLNINKFDDVPTASETLSNFNKFQKQLKQLKAEMKQDVEEEYVNKLKQLTTFSQQLEKLLPTEKVGKSALNAEEEKILEDLVNRMDDLNFIRSHHNVLHQKSTLINVPTKLDSLVDILSYCLLAVNSFNTN